MGQNGLLIEYQYCTGCFACVVACKQELGLPAQQFGIRVLESVQRLADRIAVDYIPFPTDLCDLCEPRPGAGAPACVRHCLARCMSHGPVAELARAAAGKPKTVIWAPRGAA